MSSRSSKRSNKNKSRSSNASDAGSVKEFVEREAEDDTQPAVVSASEPTSAETRQIPDTSAAAVPATAPPKISPTSSVYGEVFKEDPPAVQVAILEPEIAVAALPQEPLPIQDNSTSSNQESGWFSSLFACCVSRK